MILTPLHIALCLTISHLYVKRLSHLEHEYGRVPEWTFICFKKELRSKYFLPQRPHVKLYWPV